MMQVLLVIHLLVTLALVATILLQRSEGGALGIGGGGGGGGGMMTGRGAANLLTRITAILATVFIGLSLALAIMATNASGPRSIIDTVPDEPAAPAESPAAPVSQ